MQGLPACGVVNDTRSGGQPPGALEELALAKMVLKRRQKAFVMPAAVQ